MNFLLKLWSTKEFTDKIKYWQFYMCLYYFPLDCTKRRTSVVSLAFLNANFYCLSFQVVVAWNDYNVFWLNSDMRASIPSFKFNGQLKDFLCFYPTYLMWCLIFFHFFCFIWGLRLLLEHYYKTLGQYLTFLFEWQLADAPLIHLCPNF